MSVKFTTSSQGVHSGRNLVSKILRSGRSGKISSELKSREWKNISSELKIPVESCLGWNLQQLCGCSGRNLSRNGVSKIFHNNKVYTQGASGRTPQEILSRVAQKEFHHRQLSEEILSPWKSHPRQLSTGQLQKKSSPTPES